MRFFDNIRTWNRIRQTRIQLSSLSNRELSDIGLSRSDIQFVAKRSVSGK